MTADKLEVYEDKAGEFRWHRKAANGEVIGEGESYTSERDAWRGAVRANPDLDAPDA
jgi:uncharacterized protein YegP (UPF0339 family)